MARTAACLYQPAVGGLTVEVNGFAMGPPCVANNSNGGILCSPFGTPGGRWALYLSGVTFDTASPTCKAVWASICGVQVPIADIGPALSNPGNLIGKYNREVTPPLPPCPIGGYFYVGTGFSPGDYTLVSADATVS